MIRDNQKLTGEQDVYWYLGINWLCSIEKYRRDDNPCSLCAHH
jgi:hypothetical protein